MKNPLTPTPLRRVRLQSVRPQPTRYTLPDGRPLRANMSYRAPMTAALAVASAFVTAGAATLLVIHFIVNH